jgi:sulfonate transport system ATP-binding protein
MLPMYDYNSCTHGQRPGRPGGNPGIPEGKRHARCHHRYQGPDCSDALTQPELLSVSAADDPERGEAPRLMPWLTVEQNMTFSLARQTSKAHFRKTVDAYLDLLGLTDFRNVYPSQISAGMAQRVALGRTLCFDPDIILMDEPFGALDAFRRSLQEELVRIFLSERKTILFVTHDVDEAVFLGQRVLVMDQGRLAQETGVNLLYPRDPLSKEFYVLREEILGFFFAEL